MTEASLEPRGWGGNEGGNPTSPWVFWQIQDDPTESHVWMSMQVTFGADLVLLTGSSFRSSDCPFTRIYVGALDPATGQPKAGTRVVTVPLGTRTFTQVQLNAVGLTTVSDISTKQITADW